MDQITVGLITSYKDCVATVIGLENAMSGELVYIFSQDTDLENIENSNLMTELSNWYGF